jgi:hypothetical protein
MTHFALGSRRALSIGFLAGIGIAIPTTARKKKDAVAYHTDTDSDSDSDTDTTNNDNGIAITTPASSSALSTSSASQLRRAPPPKPKSTDVTRFLVPTSSRLLPAEPNNKIRSRKGGKTADVYAPSCGGTSSHCEPTPPIGCGRRRAEGEMPPPMILRYPPMPWPASSPLSLFPDADAAKSASASASASAEAARDDEDWAEAVQWTVAVLRVANTQDGMMFTTDIFESVVCELFYNMVARLRSALLLEAAVAPAAASTAPATAACMCLVCAVLLMKWTYPHTHHRLYHILEWAADRCLCGISLLQDLEWQVLRYLDFCIVARTF